MKITDCVIDIRDSSLDDRLKLKQVLLDNGQTVYRYYKGFDTEQGCLSGKIGYSKSSVHWDRFACMGANPNITLQDFIAKFGKQQPEIKVGSHWEDVRDHNIITVLAVKPRGLDLSIEWSDWPGITSSLHETHFLLQYKPRPDLDSQQTESNPFQVGDIIRCISNDNPVDRPYLKEFIVQKIYGTDVYYRPGFATHYSKFELVSKPTTVHSNVEPISITKEQPMNKLDLRLLTAIMVALATAEDEQLDATNSNSVVIVTKEGEYEGYFYANDIETIQKIIQEPKNELKKFHVFDYSNTFAQKPRKIIEVERS